MKRTLYTCMISTILATGLWSFQTKDSSLTEGAPLYITDITFFGKELLTSEKVPKPSPYIRLMEKNALNAGKQPSLLRESQQTGKKYMLQPVSPKEELKSFFLTRKSLFCSFRQAGGPVLRLSVKTSNTCTYATNSRQLSRKSVSKL